MSEIRIAIVGATGRMGRYLIQATQQTDGISLGAVLTRRKSLVNNEDAGELAGIGKIGVIVTNDFMQVVNEFDVLVDFTSPKGTLEHLNFCRQHKKSMVIGTTGFDHAGQKAIRIAAKEISIVFSPNFSIGMNVMISLIKQATKVMGNYADIDIIEAHHRYKIDAPSGTALVIGKTIANAMNWKLEEHMIFTHELTTGDRKPNTIAYAIVRAGDIVGEHTVIFTDIGERVEITHKASSRLTFANGAMKAACWIKKRNFGLYDMKDVLNLSIL